MSKYRLEDRTDRDWNWISPLFWDQELYLLAYGQVVFTSSTLECCPQPY